MKLNIGSGPKEYQLDGWKNIDIDPDNQPDEAYDIVGGIQEKENSVDEILISHVLMYFDYSFVERILDQCWKVLKPGGLIRITEDNSHLKIRNERQQSQYNYAGKLGQLFNRYQMEQIVRRAGFVQVKQSEPFEETKHHLNLSDAYPLPQGLATVYFIQAQKPEHTQFPTVTIFLDDFGEHNANMDLMWRLRNYFDDFRITVFAIPNDNLNDNWRSYILNLGWIRLGLHGYHHKPYEELDDKTLRLMPNYGFKRIYRPPYLKIYPKMKAILEKEGYRIVMNHDWRIDADPPIEKRSFVGYGHVYPHDYRGPKGGKGESLFLYWDKIMKLPKETRFEFVKEIGEK
jgi:predicted SAM-dependent methyltransferase